MRAVLPSGLLAIVAIVPFLACAGPHGDEMGDAGTPSALGTGFRIRQLTAPAKGDSADGFAPNPPPPPPNENGDIAGASVIITDTCDETQDGKSLGSIYVEDVGAWNGTPSQGAFSGIEMYRTPFTPASPHAAPGDVIDMTGPYQDFAGPASALFPTGQVQPEMYEPVSTFRFEYKAPAPIVVDVTDLNIASLASFDKGLEW